MSGLEDWECSLRRDCAAVAIGFGDENAERGLAEARRDKSWSAVTRRVDGGELWRNLKSLKPPYLLV